MLKNDLEILGELFTVLLMSLDQLKNELEHLDEDYFRVLSEDILAEEVF